MKELNFNDESSFCSSAAMCAVIISTSIKNRGQAIPRYGHSFRFRAIEQRLDDLRLKKEICDVWEN